MWNEEDGVPAYLAHFLGTHPGLTSERLCELYVVYLCNGSERLHELRSMMGGLAEKRIPIVILTNNRACSLSGYRVILDRFFTLPGNHGPLPYQLICPVKGRYFRHKGAALSGNEAFRTLCAIKGALPS